MAVNNVGVSQSAQDYWFDFAIFRLSFENTSFAITSIYPIISHEHFKSRHLINKKKNLNYAQKC